MSTETVPKGYKRTEVGVIPEEWELASIASVIREPIRNGYSPVCPTEDTGIWILSLAAVTNNGFNENGIKPAPRTDPRIDENLLERNDIVVSRSNTPERVGLAGIYNGTPDKCAYPDLLMRVRLNSKVQSNFLLSQLLSHTGRKYFLDNARGSSGSMVKIDRIILQNFPVLLPSETEQQAIAAALSDADALIEALEQLLAKKRQIKQGAMQELLTGKRRLPGFTGKWETKRLGEIAHIKTGSRNNQDKVDDGEYPFFVRSATVERINSYSHECEAILIPGEGGIGNIFHYIKGRFDVHQRVYAITQFSEDASGKFVHLYMATHFGAHAMQNSVKATVDSLRLPTFQEFEITLPPTLPEQAAIAAVLSDMDAELEALEAKLDKARQVKQGMMQQLLTGKIRLV